MSAVGRRITELSHVRVIDPREQMMIVGSAVGLLDAVTIAIASVAFVTGLRQGAVGLFALAPSVAAGVVVLTLLASVAGSLYPALRVISVDPAVALRFVQ